MTSGPEHPLKGGREIEAEAPLDRIPLFVRAGSIVPLGPEIEYADQQPAGPIELRIFRGANGRFDLYEDEGDNLQLREGGARAASRCAGPRQRRHSP